MLDHFHNLELMQQTQQGNWLLKCKLLRTVCAFVCDCNFYFAPRFYVFVFDLPRLWQIFYGATWQRCRLIYIYIFFIFFFGFCDRESRVSYIVKVQKVYIAKHYQRGGDITGNSVGPPQQITPRLFAVNWNWSIWVVRGIVWLYVRCWQL